MLLGDVQGQPPDHDGVAGGGHPPVLLAARGLCPASASRTVFPLPPEVPVLVPPPAPAPAPLSPPPLSLPRPLPGPGPRPVSLLPPLPRSVPAPVPPVPPVLVSPVIPGVAACMTVCMTA